VFVMWWATLDSNQ